MNREKIILGSLVGVCAAILVMALLMRGSGEKGGAPAVSTPAEETGGPAPSPGASPTASAPAVPGPGAPGVPPPAPSPSPVEKSSFLSEENRREVVLFFARTDSDFLGPERRRIFQTSSTLDQAKQIVVELINGPRSSSLLPTLPGETRLLGLYLDTQGTAYVDLSMEASALHPGGSAEELATILSIVDSLSYNLPDVKRVRILIGGEERETFKNHLDLRRAWVKDMSIVDMDGRS